MAAERLAIDHVLLGVEELAAGASALLAEQGLVSVAGGRHPGHGTANRIVPLGAEYVELLAVVDREEAAASPFGRWAAREIGREPRLLALCLQSDDLEATCRRLGLDAHPMSRRRPDGRLLSWRLAGLEAALGPERLPFFIEWEVAEEDHPGRLPAAHPVAATAITRVAMGGDVERLTGWLGEADLPVEPVGGVPGIRSVEIATAEGALTLR